MPRLVPEELDPKARELLELARSGVEKVKLVKFFLELPETTKKKLALQLHDDFELIRLGHDPLLNLLSETYAKLPEAKVLPALINMIKYHTFTEDDFYATLSRYHILKESIAELLNTTDIDGYTLLMHSIMSQSHECLDFLISQDINLNIQNNDGDTALHLAIETHMMPYAIRLLSYRNPTHPEYQALLSIPNSQGKTCIDLANETELMPITAFGFSATGQILFSLIELIKRREIPAAKQQIKTLLRIPHLERQVIDVFNFYDPQTNTSLLSTCATGTDYDFFEFIVNSALIRELNLALQHALFTAVKTANLDMIKHIIGHHAVDINCKDSKGRGLLYYAIINESIDCLNLLLTLGADPNITDSHGDIPLGTAVFQSYRPKMQEIIIALAAVSDINHGNHFGISPLDNVLKMGDHHVLSMMVSDLQPYGYTDLMLALLDRNYTAAKALILDKDCDVNALTHGGFSALMIAAQQLNNSSATDQAQIFDIIVELLKHNADATHINQDKRSFLSILATSRILEHKRYAQALLDVCNSAEFKAANHGKNLFHICFESSANIIDSIYELDISIVKLNQMLNDADAFGNSPLSYLLFDIVHGFSSDSILDLVTIRGAKFIRNGIPVKGSQHLKALLAKDSQRYLDAVSGLQTLFTPQEMRMLGTPDIFENRNTLHYACLLSKQFLAQSLINAGVPQTARDKFARTPLHYAASSGMILYNVKPEVFEIKDTFGLTPVAIGIQNAPDLTSLEWYLAQCQYSHDPVHVIIGNFKKDKPVQVIKTIMSHADLSYQQKLALIAGFHNYLKLCQEDNFEVKADMLKAYQAIVAEEFSREQYAYGKFPDNFALGIELEVPGLVRQTIMPLDQFLEVFHISRILDTTVMPSFLSGSPFVSEDHPELELTSEVIQSYQQYEKFLAATNCLQLSGATTNPSGSLHLHFNVRGTDKSKPSIGRYIDEDDEFAFLKYITANYIRIEKLLLGFMRSGNMFDPYGNAFLIPICSLESEVERCNTVEELMRVCSHKTTLDLSALARHGTIEFRIHDATINPVLINAWIDSLSRLVMTSKRQALEHKATSEFEPVFDIEQLIPLLLTLRFYAQTWDAEWGAFDSADEYVAGASSTQDLRPMQERIQSSPLYTMMQMVLDFDLAAADVAFEEKLKKYLSEKSAEFTHAGFDQAKLLEDLAALTRFLIANPGIISEQVNLEERLAIIEKINTPELKRSR